MITSDLYKVKTMATKTIKLKNKTDHELHGVPSGGVSQVKVDKNGLPFDRNWRRRLKDSKIDGCVEVVKSSPKKKEIE